MICTAYRIVLVGEIKVNKMGGQCGMNGGYRNKDGFYNLRIKKRITWEFLSG